jgi:hypothetical protein
MVNDLSNELKNKIAETYIMRLVLTLAEKFGKENLDDILDRIQKGFDGFQEKYRNYSPTDDSEQEKVLVDLIEFISQNLKDKVPNFDELALEVLRDYFKDIGLIG